MKKQRQVTKIDLGHDGAHQLSVEYKDPWGFGKGVWYFCRDGKEIRHIDPGYLEEQLIHKIVELTQK